jgi:hypothetical protein
MTSFRVQQDLTRKLKKINFLGVISHRMEKKSLTQNINFKPIYANKKLSKKKVIENFDINHLIKNRKQTFVS